MSQDDQGADEFADKEIDKPSFLRRFGLRKDKPQLGDSAPDQPAGDMESNESPPPEPPAKDANEYGKITEAVEPETEAQKPPEAPPKDDKKSKKSAQDSPPKN
jgi:hypothetical protein